MELNEPLHKINFSVTWPPGTTFGVGSVSTLGARAKARGASRALLVTDAGLVKVGLAEKVAGHLRAAGVETVLFGEVKPNPTMTEVTEGVAMLRRDGFDFLVALGGGSSIDAAKVMSMQLLSARSIEEIEAKGVDDATGTPIGFIVVPSTSGTGSEATTGALVKDASGKKYLVRSVRCRPAESILDPHLTVTVPPRMTASTGMDAFIHALGSYTNAQVNPIGDMCAQEAMRLVNGNLATAIADGGNLAARSAMMLASHLAGIAISMKGNDAIHGLSTAVESMIDCTHGESLSALMPHVLRFNLEAAAPRYANIARLMGRSGAEEPGLAAQGVEAMIGLRDRAGTCRHLSELGIGADMIERLTTLAAKGRSTQINCRRPGNEEITALYRAAL
ncbi:MAG: iron-containing alcohol dehydrogenase [Betaproteobacteria bacterium]|nr:iron-containing alcohol dehydrogenase [Betaproteobacteria bacterium]